MPTGADRERSEHHWCRVPRANRTRCQASDGLSDCVLGPWRGRTADRGDPETDEPGRDPAQLDGCPAGPGGDRPARSLWTKGPEPCPPPPPPVSAALAL